MHVYIVWLWFFDICDTVFLGPLFFIYMLYIYIYIITYTWYIRSICFHIYASYIRYSSDSNDIIYIYIPYDSTVVAINQCTVPWKRQAATMVAPKVLEQTLGAYDAREPWYLGIDWCSRRCLSYIFKYEHLEPWNHVSALEWYFTWCN